MLVTLTGQRVSVFGIKLKKHNLKTRCNATQNLYSRLCLPTEFHFQQPYMILRCQIAMLKEI